MKEFQIHPHSDVQTISIGLNTKIWQYCVVLPGAQIGSSCNICAHVFIENDVCIGNDVTIKNGVQIWDGVSIADNVFIGPNATFTNDSFPRSKHFPDQFNRTYVEKNASIGANATILPGITIGEGAMVGAGAVVTKDVPKNAIITGNPGQVMGFVGAESFAQNALYARLGSEENATLDLIVGSCRLHKLPLVEDARGSLAIAEYGQDIPFNPKRAFWIFDVPEKGFRGEHAHKTLHQFMICVKGSVHVCLDDAEKRVDVCLNKPNLGLHIPPLVWGVQFKFSNDAAVLVFASGPYDSEEYLTDYQEFFSYTKSRQQ